MQCYSSLSFLGRAHRSLLPGETLLVTWCCRSAHSISQSPKNGLQRLLNRSQCRNKTGIALKYRRCGACSIIKTQWKCSHIQWCFMKKHWLKNLPFPYEAWSPVQRHVVCGSFTWCCGILLEQVSLCQAWDPHNLCSLSRSPQLLLLQPLPCHSTPMPLGRTSLSPGRPCIWESCQASAIPRWHLLCHSHHVPCSHQTPQLAPQQQSCAYCKRPGGHSEGPGDLWTHTGFCVSCDIHRAQMKSKCF